MDDRAVLADALGEAARAGGLPAERVERVERLSGGASKESWGFVLIAPDGGETALVLRRQPPGKRFSSQGLSGMTVEAEVLRQAGRAGVPVPAVAFELPEGSPAGDGYAMARLAGETVGVRVLKDPSLAQAREALARQCGAVLARIHAMPIDPALGLVEHGARDALAALEERHRATGQARPVFEFALRWLDDNLPAEERRTFLHGDFRNGNLVVGPEGLRAVLDWELAHVGAPASDLAWICVNSWRFQRPDLAVGGFGTRDDLLAGYAEAGGSPVDPRELHAWEVFQTMNWGTMCAGGGRLFMDGARSVEGGMIARRSSETEFDLVRLLAPECEAWNAG
jgi:aminoglycoside phosphotransferase (APT) family kinase protein